MPTTKPQHVEDSIGILANLYELLETLDRRPRLERAGEIETAFDTDELREHAVSLIHRIEATAQMKH